MRRTTSYEKWSQSPARASDPYCKSFDYFSRHYAATSLSMDRSLSALLIRSRVHFYQAFPLQVPVCSRGRRNVSQRLLRSDRLHLI